jgi:hypothetical protein
MGSTVRRAHARDRSPGQQCARRDTQLHVGPACQRVMCPDDCTRVGVNAQTISRSWMPRAPPSPDEFRIDIKILQEQCFRLASATHLPDRPGYIGRGVRHPWSTHRSKQGAEVALWPSARDRIETCGPWLPVGH